MLRSDLSFYNWDTQHSTSNESPNFQILPDHEQGLLFKNKRDRKAPGLNLCSLVPGWTFTWLGDLGQWYGYHILQIFAISWFQNVSNFFKVCQSRQWRQQGDQRGPQVRARRQLQALGGANHGIYPSTLAALAPPWVWSEAATQEPRSSFLTTWPGKRAERNVVELTRSKQQVT